MKGCGCPHAPNQHTYLTGKGNVGRCLIKGCACTGSAACDLCGSPSCKNSECLI